MTRSDAIERTLALLRFFCTSPHGTATDMIVYRVMPGETASIQQGTYATAVRLTGVKEYLLPPPSKGNEVRVATIHRYKGLESPVVVLAEIDGRVGEEELASLLYVGATRARAHLVVVASDIMRNTSLSTE